MAYDQTSTMCYWNLSKSLFNFGQTRKKKSSKEKEKKIKSQQFVGVPSMSIKKCTALVILKKI